MTLFEVNGWRRRTPNSYFLVQRKSADRGPHAKHRRSEFSEDLRIDLRSKHLRHFAIFCFELKIEKKKNNLKPKKTKFRRIIELRAPIRCCRYNSLMFRFSFDWRLEVHLERFWIFSFNKWISWVTNKVDFSSSSVRTYVSSAEWWTVTARHIIIIHIIMNKATKWRYQCPMAMVIVAVAWN